MDFTLFLIFSVVFTTYNLGIIRITLKETIIWATIGVVLIGLGMLIDDYVIFEAFLMIFNGYILFSRGFKSFFRNLIMVLLIYFFVILIIGNFEFILGGDTRERIILIVYFSLEQIIAKIISVNIIDNVSPTHKKKMHKHIIISGVILVILMRILVISLHMGKSEEVYWGVREFIFLGIVASIFGIALLIKNIRSELILENNKREARALREYSENMQAMYDEMRKFKHDHVNIMNSIYGYLVNDDVCGAREYFENRIQKESKKHMADFNFAQLKNIQEPELKGIISSKIMKAKHNGIRVSVDIQNEVDFKEIDIIHLCRVIGILFDNAIEEGINKKEYTVDFGIIHNESSKDIIIRNTCYREDIVIANLFKMNYSTKGTGRGIGLYTLKEIVNGYSNVYIETSIEDDKFTQIITVAEE